MATGLSPINRALNLVPKRAESRQVGELRLTFVDSGVAAALEAIDHQVLYGRRGTGKTHALRYLESELIERGEIALFVDLRTVGSPDGLFGEDRLTGSERAARLLVDVLGEVHNSILEAALEDDQLLEDKHFLARLDALSDAVTSIRVSGEVEVTEESASQGSTTREGGLEVNVSASPSLGFHTGSGSSVESRDAERVTRRGTEQPRLNFTQVARALRELAESLRTRRLWLLLDEWSSVPQDLQPFLGEFLVRCVFPIQQFTVKIGAIEQQSTFRVEGKDGQQIGIELGADASANVDLDEFMVFEQNEERARDFFLGLFFRHLTLGVDESDKVPRLDSERDLVRLGFTERRAFDELVRSAEGVPRDAINIAAKAALRAGANVITVPDIRAAARSWFQSDKEAALRSREEASSLLNHIIDSVIRQRKARGFLVNQRSARSSLLKGLFDARVLHLVRRGYSAQDEPGERYDVYVIDYGAYVDLILTNAAPRGLFGAESDEMGGESSDLEDVDVPTQDLRAIRRSILDIDAFELSLLSGEQP